jgi:acyl carrier protein phosphodiesterase
MNFLAHLYLSGNDPKLMIGNFIGDFVKGKNALSQFEPDIIRGVELHRSIDEFTDTHPVVSESKNRLRPKYRHYSGVIVDVFYDHFLASNWSLFHPSTLHVFADSAYELMEKNLTVLPQEVRSMLPYMIKGNWLVNYGKVEGIHRALSGMASRTPFVSKMDEAKEDLVTHYDAFKKEFLEFFPTLKEHCESKIAGWNQART